MKRMNIPDELKRFTDPGPGTADAGVVEEGAGGDGADAPEEGAEQEA